MIHDIRTAVASDADDLLLIAEATGLFDADDLSHMADDIAAWADGTAERMWLTTSGGAAMLAPEPMSGAVWNTPFIGVAPSFRRRGLARALVMAAEDVARGEGGRIMLIETGSTDDLAPARALYAASGYAAEATIRDFYAEGVDRVTYSKRL